MPNAAYIMRADTMIAELTGVVDGWPQRQHELTSIIGGEPLEDGRETTDHVVAAQGRLKLTGRVNNPDGTWEAIKDLHKKEEPFTVITEWETIDEVVIERVRADTVGAFHANRNGTERNPAGAAAVNWWQSASVRYGRQRIGAVWRSVARASNTGICGLCNVGSGL